jgi:hypothetical protein
MTPELEGWRFGLEESLHVDVPHGTLSAALRSLAADIWTEAYVCVRCVCVCACVVCGDHTGGLKVADKSDAAAVLASEKEQGVRKTLLLDKARRRVELVLHRDNWDASLLLVERPIPARGPGSFPDARVVCRVSCVVCRVPCAV